MKHGKFVISLDFELFWGVRDVTTIKDYGENIKNVHQVVPKLLECFDNYDVKTTFSIVGFLFFDNKDTLLNHLPDVLPNYTNSKFSPYPTMENELNFETYDDLYFFAPRLIELIKQYPKQEIGSHTFSHYYCLEEGQTIESFKSDLIAAIEIAKKNNMVITSLVFPRNQINDDYIKICKELNFTCYRGNEHSWLYKAKKGTQDKFYHRILRLIDSYINLSGHNCYSDEYLKSKFPVDIPASRFLRPYNNSLKIFEKFRMHRILSGMTYAAKEKLTYHLWWHPHNFGTNQDENFKNLEMILKHYKYLQKSYDFTSISMSELAKNIHNGA